MKCVKHNWNIFEPFPLPHPNVVHPSLLVLDCIPVREDCLFNSPSTIRVSRMPYFKNTICIVKARIQLKLCVCMNKSHEPTPSTVQWRREGRCRCLRRELPFVSRQKVISEVWRTRAVRTIEAGSAGPSCRARRSVRTGLARSAGIARRSGLSRVAGQGVAGSACGARLTGRPRGTWHASRGHVSRGGRRRLPGWSISAWGARRADVARRSGRSVSHVETVGGVVSVGSLRTGNSLLTVAAGRTWRFFLKFVCYCH